MGTPSQLLPRFVRRAGRRLYHGLISRRFELVTHPRYNAAFPELPNDALRADRILAFLASEGIVQPCCIHRPEPVWLKALALVHGAEYLDSIHDRQVLGSIMGTELAPGQVDRLIDLQRLMTGGTLMATRRARGRGIGVNLGGGLHHASAHQGAGFCIFNDVAVAIADERRRGFRGRVLVVDLDLHDGDGTRRIFAEDPTVHTFSIHGRHWGPTEAVASTAIELGPEVEDERYLETISEHLPPLVERFDPQLIFYLAGCDPAHDDLLGDWKITADAMLRRDQLVFELARHRHPRLPLVVVLAGGYSQESWRYTARFLANPEPRKRTIEPPSTEEITLKRYRYIGRLFDAQELSGATGSDNFGITEADLYLPGWGANRETRFLGFYTKNGLELLFERSGFLDRLRDVGFEHPTLVIRVDDRDTHTLRIFGAPDLAELLVEIQLRRDRRLLPGFELLSIEWLLMQNPRAQFQPGRPRLPGQEHPGLGLLNDAVAMLRVSCERLHLDGLAFVPSAYHIAAFGRGRLYFVDAQSRATFAALHQLLAGLPLAEATRAVAEGRVSYADTGEPFAWKPAPMVLPVSRRLLEHVGDETHEGPRPRLRLDGAPSGRPSSVAIDSPRDFTTEKAESTETERNSPKDAEEP